MNTKGYRGLQVWRRARDLAMEVCRATSGATFNRDWALRDQLRRAAISVASNIAEGNERGSKREMARFCYYARGSLAELSTQAEIAAGIGFLDGKQAARWQQECDELAGMLMRLIRAVSSAESNPSRVSRLASHV
jgi:four helix bundle protein